MSKEVIFDKAKELSDLIAHSDEKKAAQETSRRLMENEEASGLIGMYNVKRESKLAEYKDKQPTPEEIEEINSYLETEFNKIMENEIIKEYVKASREFEMLLTRMDNIIKQGVSPEHSEGCNGSCHSCSGCGH